ncbi:MAG: formylglycine-generating enzyme family protein [Bacteroidales bacterium]|nr:formylglycine-generating enzyme family protein [Bacteroidales bacterium]
MKTFRLIFAMQLIFASLAFSASNSASQSGSNRTFTVSGVSFTMVYVQGGTFTMGCTDEQGGNGEKPAHQVTLSSYYVGKFEVTQALWQAVMGSNPSNFKGDNLPVEQVSWEDCKGFISQLNVKTGQNFRLPTEAEWEYAARGGSWYSFSQNCRVSFRYNYTHVLSSYYLGFRLALSK